MARTAHAVVGLVVVAALVIQLVVLLRGGADANSGAVGLTVPVPVRLVRLVSYFTIQSNLLVLAASLSLVVRPERDGPVWRVLRLDSLLGIAVTGIVYALVLAPAVHLEGASLLAGLGFHLVAPVGALLVWLLLGPRPRITWAVVGWSFSWPVAWIVYTFVHGALTGWYPYAFVDAGLIGYPRAAAGTLAVLGLGMLIAVVLVRVDRRLTTARR